MALRKAGAYSKRYARPYTRKSTKKSKSYIKTVPPQKIVRFRMGDIKGFEEGKFKFTIQLMAGEDVQIRDNALEASRQYINKILETNATGQFYFEVKPFPHHIIRENKMLTGAGADRMQTGMAHSFGQTIGRAAFVKKNQPIFIVGTATDKIMRLTIKSFEKIKAKLPCRSIISVQEKK